MAESGDEEVATLEVAPDVEVEAAEVEEVAVEVVEVIEESSPRPCVYLTTLIGLFIRDQSPARAVCSLLAMCWWFWPGGCGAEEKDVFLGSALLTVRRLFKDKLARLLDHVAACLACEKSPDQTTALLVTQQYHYFSSSSIGVITV